MKISSRILTFLALLWAPLMYGQNTEIKNLNFPYKNGYIFTMTDTTIIYDQYNFPAEQTMQDITYTVSDDPNKKGVLRFMMEIKDNETGKQTHSSQSYLTLDKKGMSWWVDKDEKTKESGKPTQAIKTPMKKGTEWTSVFSDTKATMTCITTDTLLQTMYGQIPCFAVSYTLTFEETKEMKYYMVVKEYYHPFGGKVFTEDESVLLDKVSNKKRTITKSWSSISYSNLTEDQIKLITASN